MPEATTMPPAAAKITLPASALMSMPRCQPFRRRPYVELTGPSTGHRNGGASSTKSGTASSSPRGPRAVLGVVERGAPAVGRRAVAAAVLATGAAPAGAAFVPGDGAVPAVEGGAAFDVAGMISR